MGNIVVCGRLGWELRLGGLKGRVAVVGNLDEVKGYCRARGLDWEMDRWEVARGERGGVPCAVNGCGDMRRVRGFCRWHYNYIHRYAMRNGLQVGRWLDGLEKRGG